MSEEQVREHRSVEQGQLVMPFYLICDVSYSMVNDMPALNDNLQRLRRAIVAQPVVDDVAHICIMTFSDTAKVVMPLGQMSEQSVPALSVDGGTNYGAAFRELASTIKRDADALKQQGYKIWRPCAFFLTDGEPLDNDWWETFKSTLTYDRTTGVGMKQHPVFIPYGFRDAPEDVLRKLAYPLEKGKWFHVKSHDIEQALSGILNMIMTSVVSSGMSSQTGQPTLVHPQPNLPGMSSGDADVYI
ncbi:MAG TPA: VWA domain-containing protein [Trebonia sp.]